MNEDELNKSLRQFVFIHDPRCRTEPDIHDTMSELLEQTCKILIPFAGASFLGAVCTGDVVFVQIFFILLGIIIISYALSIHALFINSGEFNYSDFDPPKSVIKPVVEQKNSCIACGGTGRCVYCRGSGLFNYYVRQRPEMYKNCMYCNGTGSCTTCNGTGHKH